MYNIILCSNIIHMYTDFILLSSTVVQCLWNAGDRAYFKCEEALSVDAAHRYVCMPLNANFSDHVWLKTEKPDTDVMLRADETLPKLFNVSTGIYKFHWSCFVLQSQVLLFMWLSSMEDYIITSLVDEAASHVTENVPFRRMVYYLAKWFKSQYSATDRTFDVVLDCTPENGSFLKLLGSVVFRAGMKTLNHHNYVEPKADIRFNLGAAQRMFTFPPDVDAYNFDIIQACGFHNQP